MLLTFATHFISIIWHISEWNKIPPKKLNLRQTSFFSNGYELEQYVKGAQTNLS